MTEPARGPETAGSLLRAAREKQGLHIAALAAAIKVTPRKLDALENNRWDELPDATFTRALAQTVCRTLKVDARPVLDLLPAPGASTLENVAGTLNTPFSERGHSSPGLMGAAVRPMVWAGALLLVAALVVYFVPSAFWTQLAGGNGSNAATAPAFPASDALSSPVALESAPALPAVPPQEAAFAPASAAVQSLPGSAAASGPGAGAVASPAVTAAASAEPATTAPAPVADTVVLQAVQASWVEARDAQGRSLVSRLLAPGEQLQINGELPIRLVIGNAVGVELTFRQQRIDLPALTRDNVARLQLP
jgi:cytoskeleton protein RodZ